MRTGRCLCGAVTWSTDADVRSVLECHCERCQRLTGNYMAATAAPTNELVIVGDTLRWYSPADDPNVGYGFCSSCGSTLFFRSGLLDGTNTITSMCAGSIDGPSGLHTSEIWFADNAGDHVRLDASITRYAAGPTGS
ncbi:MAG: GFA family protein [Ilumatobacter sp.]|uniref:GFA family protein n=1 Tax=Ilumatobacter sp. TaxID=1967498 RepID=UPI003C752378